MRKDEKDESTEKCRERRRRRIEMRRLATLSEGVSFSPPRKRRPVTSSLDLYHRTNRSKASVMIHLKDIASSSTQTSSESSDELAPSFGLMSLAGRSSEMEDRVNVRTCLCRPDLTGRVPVHFFGVYDGHGGPHVATFCRDRMHVLLEEELLRGGDLTESEESFWRRTMKRTFERMDEFAVSMCERGSEGCNPTDMEIAGSTAVVAVVTVKHVVVANCGDSRAILCRDGSTVPLSSDHKPDRPDELDRIEAAGGKVVFVNGPRVEGILAMSRSIGDRYLKPMVTSEPEISFTQRDEADSCVILASDGLWDVVSSELACEVACQCLCLSGGDEEGVLYASPSAMAAALLARLAIGRKSSDNISVIVVDLKRCEESDYRVEGNVSITL